MKVLTKQLTKDEIFIFLNKVDSSFIPIPLSNRINLKLYSEKLAINAMHFSVEEDNCLIGICCCYMNDTKKKKAFISVICIDSEYKGIGLGKKLILECEAHAKKLGYKCVESEVHIENVPSIEMFKTIGYYIERQEKKSFYLSKLI
jgi:ribosomal protein S18 acetylase RimI-like enzyme